MIQKLLYGFAEETKERNFDTMSKMDRKTFIVFSGNRTCSVYIGQEGSRESL